MLNPHIWVDFSKSCSGAFKFAQAKTRLAMEYLALEIRKFDGVRINNADAQNTVLQDRSISIQTEISDLRDADIETLITELQTIMVTRDAARQTYSTINSQSLFDFLK